jgi:hypothetical protein
MVPEWAISRLETLPEPLFKLTVLHLLGGGSVTGLAGYIRVAVRDKRGPMSDCSQESLRRYLTAMRLRLKEWLQNPTIETAAPWLRMVLETANSDSDGGVQAGVSEVDELTRLAALAEHADALTLLKHTFLVGVQRLKSLRAMESRYGVLLPVATEHIRVMGKIVSEMLKIELIEAFPRLKQNEGRRIIRAALRSFSASVANPPQG